MLDFDLLYRYMFEHDSSPDWSHALTYLFRSQDTTYLVGPGTEIEIHRLLGQVPAPPECQPNPFPIPDASALALTRLRSLLDQQNVLAGQEVPAGSDAPAFEQVKQSLDSSRPRALLANHADALNWAYVVHLRRNIYELGLEYFPYLLTSTTLLLDPQALDPDHTVAISRSTQAAIYCKVLLDVYPDPSDAMRHTIEMAFESAKVRRTLSLSPAWVDPTRLNDAETDWEQVLLRHDVTPDFEAEISALASYFDDPVLYETQRIYDNTYFAATSHAQLGGSYPFVGETPRRLFDLISAISAALATSDERRISGVPNLWETVLSIQFTHPPECVIVEIVDRSQRGNRPPYLIIEVHRPAPSRDVPLFVMRWPSSRDAASLVTAFTTIFQANGVTDLSLTMGTTRDVYEFDAKLPITLDEMSDALSVAALEEEGPTARPSEMVWFRADAPTFDLYADVQAPVPQDALVGVFGEQLTALPIADLYSATSSRYIFPAWLRAALVEIGRLLPPILVERSESSGAGFWGEGAD